MSDPRFLVRKAAVLGAGVMGAQIAAHLANAGVAPVLFDLPAKEDDPNGVVRKALDGLARLEPSPLAARDRLGAIRAANYDQHLPMLADCDLVIEAISERTDWKHALYARVAPHLAPHAVLATNTSGLSIAGLAQGLPEGLRRRFCGVHFFNPPRYMHLVEIVAGPDSDPAMLDALETFLTTTLGKGVIRARDTPNFVANRVGVFSLLATIHHTQRLGLPFDVVDALTGPGIGRPRSATYRTMDVVGLDTTAHVVRTLRETLPDDPWHAHFATPAWIEALVAKGALGQKAKAGIYRRAGREIQVLDLAAGDYRPSAPAVDPEVARVARIRAPGERLAALRAHAHPQAQLLWSSFRDVFHYCAYHLEAIADNARDLDLALRWGFGWQQGPFETWQAAGWKQVAQWIAEDVAAGRAMSTAALPEWVTDGRDGVHGAQGSWSPATRTMRARSALPVYRRQPFPDPVLGERPAQGTTVFEDDAVRMWHAGDEVAVLSFKSKMHAIGDDVLDGTLRAIESAERDFAALVLWQASEPFSAGANLAQVAPVVQAGGFDVLEKVVAKFQHASQRLKYAMVPTVAAVRGLALGGGCEFVMHCDRAVAALESYIGLVEVGVGLLPAGGGCKELALRAAQEAKGGDLLHFVRQYFQTVAMATVAKSALHARELGYLRGADTVVFHPHELLHVARVQARALAEAGYRPPLPARAIPVAGKTGIAAIKMLLVNMREAGYVSAYDYDIGCRIAEVMCGGEVDAGSLVDEKWLLDLERRHFVELLRQPNTQARIAHMLETGKPLRN